MDPSTRVQIPVPALLPFTRDPWSGNPPESNMYNQNLFNKSIESFHTYRVVQSE